MLDGMAYVGFSFWVRDTPLYDSDDSGGNGDCGVDGVATDTSGSFVIRSPTMSFSPHV